MAESKAAVPDVLHDETEHKAAVTPVKPYQYPGTGSGVGGGSQRRRLRKRIGRKGTPAVRKQYAWAKQEDFKIKEEDNELSGVQAFLRFNRIPTEQRDGVWQVKEDESEAVELLAAERNIVGGEDADAAVVSDLESQEPTSSRKSLVTDDDDEDDDAPPRDMRSRSQLVLKVERRELDDSTWRGKLKRVTENIWFTVIMMALTVWALFGTDVGIILVPKDDAIILGVFMLFVVISFVLEMIVLSIVHPLTYFWGFFFWMDFIAILSLVPDILIVFGTEFDTTDASAFTLARVGRMARAAVRTARLVRLVKVFELFFLWMERRQRRGDRLNWMDQGDGDDDDKVPDSVVTHDTKRINNNMERMVEKSVLGEALLDSMFKKVFLMILVFAVVLSFLDPQVVYDKTLTQARISVLQTHAVYTATSPTDVAFLRQVEIMRADKLVFLSFEGAVEVDDAWIRDSRRSSELYEVDIACGAGACVAVYDIRNEAVAAALRSMYFTLFTIFILVVGSGSIHGTLRDLVVKPVERMVGVVKLLALKPLATLQLKEDFAFETGLVESMLLKMGRLLQIGFGVAGAHIITSNLSSSGALVPIAPGRRVQAVFMFVQVHQFFDITDALHENVLIFLNRVAQLVHAIAGQYGGFPYESSGLGTTSLVFLLPYRAGSQTDEEFNASVQKVHEAALKAAREICMAIRSPSFVNFMAKVPRVKKLQLGFGLHNGWSVAGPVGSNLKVDASYVSAHVHEASLLMEHTSTYGLNMLMSGDFRNCLTQAAQKATCLVDNSLLLGAVHPLRVYTTDEQLLDNDVTSAADRQRLKPLYSSVVDAYLGGDWARARSAIDKLLGAFPAYAPALMVQKFMQRTDYKAPDNWKGVRVWEED